MTRDEWSWAPVHEARAGQPEEVAPSKPAPPRAPARARQDSPEPIDLDIDEVATPYEGPDPDEVLPEAWSPTDGDRGPAAQVEASYRTSVEALGATAAANAALHAAGAPTPLAGVPQVRGRILDPAPLADEGPAFTPVLADDAARPTAASSPAPAMAPVPAVPSWATIAATVPKPGSDDEPTPALYRPRVPAEASGSAGARPAATAGSEAPAGGDAGDGGDGTGVDEGRTPGRAWPLILVGLVILGAAFAAAWFLLLRPEAITLPEQHVLSVPSAEPGSTLEPFVPTDPSPFLAAMPTAAGDWTLIDAAARDAASDGALPGRIAEAYLLTYSDGTDEVTVVARQLYSQEDAAKALAKVAGKGADLTEATVDGTVVGERAVLESDDVTRVAWTNGSALFVAKGAAEDVADLAEMLGL
ncbi:hypothetical protein [Demequina subtropica]|uniref:hypothetical protein n=1 Tax=Demequina subtropica TaxID=1638989 RepID=UPI0007818A59|nr:hypothetical protein [Demequina subtropica]